VAMAAGMFGKLSRTGRDSWEFRVSAEALGAETAPATQERPGVLLYLRETH
jgi:hypothetical protein